MKRNYLLGLASAFLLTLPAIGNAGLIGNLQIINSTRADFTLSGTLDDIDPINGHIISISDPYGIDPTGLENRNAFLSSTLTVGGTPIDIAYTLGPDFGFPVSIYFFNSTYNSGYAPFVLGSVVSGTISLSMPSGLTFVSAGSGVLRTGLGGPVVGSWSTDVISAPEPGTLALVCMGLVCLGLFRRRKRIA